MKALDSKSAVEFIVRPQEAVLLPQRAWGGRMQMLYSVSIFLRGALDATVSAR